MSQIRSILESVKSGDLDIEAALKQMRNGLYEDLGHSRVDHDRLERNGAAEVVFGQGKTADQISGIIKSLANRGQDVLVTRISRKKADKIKPVFPDAIYYQDARILTLRKNEPKQTET